MQRENRAKLGSVPDPDSDFSYEYFPRQGDGSSNGRQINSQKCSKAIFDDIDTYQINEQDYYQSDEEFPVVGTVLQRRINHPPHAHHSNVTKKIQHGFSVLQTSKDSLQELKEQKAQNYIPKDTESVRQSNPDWTHEQYRKALAKMSLEKVFIEIDFFFGLEQRTDFDYYQVEEQYHFIAERRVIELIKQQIRHRFQSGEQLTIDYHGLRKLFFKDYLDQIWQLIMQLMKLKGDVVKPVKFITGKGKHSKRIPFLKPMFQNWCRKLNKKKRLRYVPIPDYDSGYGSFLVTFIYKNS